MYKRIILTVAVVSSTAFSQQPTSTAEVKAGPKISKQAALLLGIGAGYTNERSDVVERRGMPSNIKVIGSFYSLSQNWIFDAGLGLATHRHAGKDAPSADTTMKGGLFEASARYNLGSNWQVGPTFNHFMDQGDYYLAKDAGASFAGLQVLKEFAYQQAVVRVGGRAMTLANPTDRNTVNMGMLDLQIGWGRDTQPASAAVAAVTPSADASIVGTEKLNSQAGVDLVFTTKLSNASEQFATFPVSGSKLRNEDRIYMQKLAAALKANQNLFSGVRVKGYADISGSKELNKSLSQQRANSVVDYLASSLDQTKTQIQGVGMGAARSPSVLATDRRVDLEFTGVKNASELKKVLESIR